MSFEWLIKGLHDLDVSDWIVVCLNSLNKNPDGLREVLAHNPQNKKCYISSDLNQLAYYTSNPQEQFTSWENLVRREFFIH